MRPLALALILAAVGATAARAGEAACRLERGVLVAPAQVMGVAGDFIIDTGQAQTQLAETQAQEAGFVETQLTGAVELAGLRRAPLAVAVADLDARTVFLSTPIAGVIGLDMLRDQVVDVSFGPCRLALHAPAAAPGFRAGRAFDMGWEGGLPVVQATVSDGAMSWPGAFTPSTGLDLSLRLDDRLAGAPGATKPQELYPGGVWRASLEALTFAGDIYRNVDTGLVKAPPDGVQPAGMIGGPVLSRYRLRFDFPGGRLLIGRLDAPSAVAAKGRRLSGPRCARASYSSPRAGRRTPGGRSWRPGRTACAPPSSARRPR